MSEKIFITGADGFIGSHLVEALIRSNRDVRAFVQYNSFDGWGWLDSLPLDIRGSLDVIAGDVRDQSALKQAMQDCSKVLHLAALIPIPYSYRAPESYVDVNIKGTLNMLLAARDLGLEKIVQTSTSEVYGSAQSVPISETHPLAAQSPYAATKIAADQLAYSFHQSFGMPVAIARPFNTYGPRQSLRAVIPTVILQISQGKRMIELGALYPTRDFNYVADTVQALVAILDNPQTVGEVTNIGTGYEVSIGDLVGLITSVMGADVEVRQNQQRLRPKESEVDRLCADNSKAKRILDWEPANAGLDGLRQGLADTVSWFLNPENQQNYSRINSYIE